MNHYEAILLLCEFKALNQKLAIANMLAIRKEQRANGWLDDESYNRILITYLDHCSKAILED